MFDFSATSKPQQIQDNLIAYARLYKGLPGITIHDADTFWFVRNQIAPGDRILRARWNDAEADAQIDATIAQISRHTDQMSWLVFPCDQPADLGARLAARGFQGGRSPNWMWADLTTLAPLPTIPSLFHIKEVCSDTLLDEWIRLSEAGVKVDLSSFHTAYQRDGYGAAAQTQHYIGYQDGVPVTTGSVMAAGGCATIYDISTPAAYRGQGFASTLTHALMTIIRGWGYADTWIWSSAKAKSVYQKLGYIEADFGIEMYRWHK
ncbi:MAG: GNAT family N-acetyltransferase [Chloroflexi bacterium]|nr:GNAT family N-acetyltransferase [Chloroflexota bacterium]MCC6891582.1 GNAT family N-acetyltransferase [Anaerolineae bacterium]